MSLRQFVTNTFREHLEREHTPFPSSDPPWMDGFGGLADLATETSRILNLIEDAFDSIDPEPEQ